MIVDRMAIDEPTQGDGPADAQARGMHPTPVPASSGPNARSTRTGTSPVLGPHPSGLTTIRAPAPSGFSPGLMPSGWRSVMTAPCSQANVGASPIGRTGPGFGAGATTCRARDRTTACLRPCRHRDQRASRWRRRGLVPLQRRIDGQQHGSS